METAPAWIQAIGTLIALFLAIAVPWSQHRQDQKQRERDKTEYRNAIRAVAKTALDQASSIVANIHDSDQVFYEGLSLYNLPRYSQALSTVTLESLPQEKAYLALFSFRKDIEILMTIVENVNNHRSGEGVHPDHVEGANELIRQASQAYTDFESTLKK